MKIFDKKYLNNKFERKIVEVRKLEAKKHHQNDMYAKPLQNKRKDAIIQILKNNVEGKTFYDVGCAEGLFCNLALLYGALSAKGVDVVEPKIEKAKSQFPDCEFEIGNVLDLKETSKYGLILCSEVLQHIVDYKKCLSGIENLLEKNGIMILSTPNLSQGNKHIFADIKPEYSPEELLCEIGGASFGKQNAIWKFNTKLLCKQVEDFFPLKLINYEKIGAKPINNQTAEQAKNLFSVMVFEKL